MSESLDLRLLLILARLYCGLFTLLKLLAREKFSLAVAPDFVKLAHELCIFQIEEIFVSALAVQVLLVGGEFIQV